MSTSSETEHHHVHLKQILFAFCEKKGAIPAVLVISLLSFGIGGTFGIVPECLSDRFARLYHQYTGAPCWTFDKYSAPKACQLGSQDGENASAWSVLLLNIFTLLFNPILGGISDVRGRRIMLISSVFLTAIPYFIFVITLQINSLDPFWYYLTSSFGGILNYMSILFAAMSDIMPDEYRASSYAIIVAGFYFGFVFGPSFPLILDHVHVSILSFSFMIMSLFVAVFFFPETLREDSMHSNQAVEASENQPSGDVASTSKCICTVVTRPLRDLSILNRNGAIRLISLGSFFSQAVFFGDYNLVTYYIEDELGVRDKDIASLFFLTGCLGLLLQTVFIQPLIQLLGMKRLIVTTFISGIFHNFLYGVARDKITIYFALSFSQFTNINYALLSSYASNEASASEQGQVQGALFAVNALGGAVGPLLMQYFNLHAQETLGPGSMFFLASFLYALGTIFVSLLKEDTGTEASVGNYDSEESAVADLEEPLLDTDTVND